MVETALAIAGSAAGVVLINKISDAVGWYVAPRQTVRMALGESKADLIRAKSKAEIADIEAADLIQRAEFRSAVEQIVQQANLESIISKALLKLGECANPQDMERDWICNFLDRCRNVSDEEMQNLWANILAGEASEAGSFSRKTVNIMADIDANYAKLFSTYCRYIVKVGDIAVPLTILDNDDVLSEIYVNQGIDYNSLRILADLGLVSTGFNPISIHVHQQLAGIPDKVELSYGEQSAVLSCPTGHITTGISTLTSAGIELASLSMPPDPVEGFFEFICEHWNTMCQGRATLSGGGTVLHYPG